MIEDPLALVWQFYVLSLRSVNHSHSQKYSRPPPPPPLIIPSAQKSSLFLKKHVRETTTQYSSTKQLYFLHGAGDFNKLSLCGKNKKKSGPDPQFQAG